MENPDRQNGFAKIGILAISESDGMMYSIREQPESAISSMDFEKSSDERVSVPGITEKQDEPFCMESLEKSL